MKLSSHCNVLAGAETDRNVPRGLLGMGGSADASHRLIQRRKGLGLKFYKINRNLMDITANILSEDNQGKLKVYTEIS